MANITLKQLSYATDELTRNESKIIIGGNFFNFIQGVGTIALGISNVSTGILGVRGGLQLLNGGAPAGNTLVSSVQTLAFQEFFSPDPIAGV